MVLEIFKAYYEVLDLFKTLLQDAGELKDFSTGCCKVVRLYYRVLESCKTLLQGDGEL